MTMRWDSWAAADQLSCAVRDTKSVCVFYSQPVLKRGRFFSSERSPGGFVRLRLHADCINNLTIPNEKPGQNLSLLGANFGWRLGTHSLELHTVGVSSALSSPLPM